jgi:hypothetical protein
MNAEQIGYLVGMFIGGMFYATIFYGIMTWIRKQKWSWTTFGALSIVFAIGGLFISGAIPTKQTPNENLATDYSHTVELEPEMATYHKFQTQGTPYDVEIKLDSTGGAVDVYFVKSERDFDYFLQGLTFNQYPECSQTGLVSGTLKCTVSMGGIIIYNPNNITVIYTLS